MKFEIGDTVTDETGIYVGVVCIKWNDGDICTIENDAAHPNPRHLTSHSSGQAKKCAACGRPVENNNFDVCNMCGGW